MGRFRLRMFRQPLKSDHHSGSQTSPRIARRLLSPTPVQLFSGLQKEEIKSIEAAATSCRFEMSRIIARASEPAKCLFLIRGGCVDYYVTNEAGQDILLRRLAAGDVFGVGALLANPTGYIGTAKAIRSVEVLEWEDRVIRQLAIAYPQIMENALRTALRYLALYAKRHIGLVSNTAQERLACALSCLGTRTGHAVPGGVEVGIRNEDLASLADVSFYTACRVLKHWDCSGAVEKSRGKVIIRSPERLLATEA